MAFQETFVIIAFRSRQHALQFSQILRNYGYQAQLMSTPKEVSMGCGLCLRFSPYMTSNVMEIYKKYNKPIIGFYRITRMGNRNQLLRINHE